MSKVKIVRGRIEICDQCHKPKREYDDWFHLSTDYGMTVSDLCSWECLKKRIAEVDAIDAKENKL